MRKGIKKGEYIIITILIIAFWYLYYRTKTANRMYSIREDGVYIYNKQVENEDRRNALCITGYRMERLLDRNLYAETEKLLLAPK